MSSEHVTVNLTALHGKLFKVIVLGDGFVGKTAITVRFCEDRFQKEYKMTIGVNFGVKKLTYNSEPYALQIWDVAGQQRFLFLRTRYYAGAFGVILVYDSTNKLTFQNLANWTQEFQEQIGNRPVVVVGNKIDLPTTGYIDPRSGKQYEKEVSYEEGKEFADSIAAPFYETSAKQNYNISEMFLRLIDLIERKKASISLDLDSYKTIEFGFKQLDTLIEEGVRSKIFDGLLKLKHVIFKQNPYSIVLGNLNQWIDYVPKVQFNPVVRNGLTKSKDAWKLHYNHSLEEGQAVTAKI